MAQPTWIKVDPMTGSGTKDIKITASLPNNGRKERKCILKYGADGIIGSQNSREIIQLGSGLKLLLNVSNVSAKGGAVKIYGTSNAYKLKFEVFDNRYNSTSHPIIETYKITGLQESVWNDGVIPGDMGKDDLYDFEAVFQADPNKEVVSFNYGVRCTAYASVDENLTPIVKQGTATVSAADEFFQIEGGTSDITLAATGETKTIRIESNVAWTLSFD